MRRQHILKHTHGQYFPSAVLSVEVDTEDTADGDQLWRRLRRWFSVATILGKGRPGLERCCTGAHASDWWRSLDWLVKRGGVIWIISSKVKIPWGLMGLWDRLESGEVYLVDRTADGDGRGVRPVNADNHGYLVLEDPPCIAHLKVRSQSATIHWVDARNYGIEAELKDIGAQERAGVLHDFAIRMIGTLKARHLGSLKDTAGAQAFYSFRKKHLSHIMICHDNEPALTLERAAYFSGRNECFQLGRIKGRVYEYDYCRLYQSVCASLEVPCRLSRVERWDCPLSVAAIRDASTSIADVGILTDTPDYPFRHRGLVVWPTGRFRTTLAGPELQDAYDRGRILRVYSLAEYELEPALKHYAVEMDVIRREAELAGDKLLKAWSKQMAVCLPGKFGQRERRWQLLDCDPPRGMYDEGWCRDDAGKPIRWRTVAGATMEQVVGEWSDEAIPAIAAWITSAGRMRLLEAIRLVGREHCYYCDTDSLFVDEWGRDVLASSPLFSPGEMGYLRLEEVHDHLDILGLKHYRDDNALVAAGLPGEHFRGVDGLPRYWSTPWLGWSGQTHERPGSRATLKSYARPGTYLHGIVGPDGRVTPFHFGG